jgi:hypothetical protein
MIPSPARPFDRGPTDASLAVARPTPHAARWRSLLLGERDAPRAGMPARRTTATPMRAGVTLGLLIAAVAWAWIAVVGAVAGSPLRTFTLMGGVVAFTVVHVALCVTYGIVLVSILHAAEREPTLVAGLVFFSLLLEVAFAMLTAVLAATRVGPIAWIQIFGGSLLVGAITLAIVARRHDLASLMERSHHEE